MMELSWIGNHMLWIQAFKCEPSHFKKGKLWVLGVCRTGHRVISPRGKIYFAKCLPRLQNLGLLHLVTQFFFWSGCTWLVLTLEMWQWTLPFQVTRVNHENMRNSTVFFCICICLGGGCTRNWESVKYFSELRTNMRVRLLIWGGFPRVIWNLTVGLHYTPTLQHCTTPIFA